MLLLRCKLRFDKGVLLLGGPGHHTHLVSPRARVEFQKKSVVVWSNWTECY
jgi:hypothetical protein